LVYDLWSKQQKKHWANTLNEFAWLIEYAVAGYRQDRLAFTLRLLNVMLLFHSLPATVLLALHHWWKWYALLMHY
jgi:hypothetical protein